MIYSLLPGIVPTNEEENSIFYVYMSSDFS